MDFDIKTLIHKHNDRLERQVEQNHFLNQRIKAKLKTQQNPQGLVFRFRKAVMTYGFLFLLLTLVNLLVIDWVRKKNTPPRDNPQTNYILRAEAFLPDYPGSVSRAYTEVAQWENQ